MSSYRSFLGGMDCKVAEKPSEFQRAAIAQKNADCISHPFAARSDASPACFSQGCNTNHKEQDFDLTKQAGALAALGASSQALRSVGVCSFTLEVTM